LSDHIVSTETDPELTETIDAIWRGAVRRRWWIFLALVASSIISIAVAFRLPNRYTSEAILVVVQPEVSQRYVTQDTAVTIADAANALTREILSRPRLIAVIEEFGLYSKEKTSLTREELVDRMRRDVDMEPLDLAPLKGEFSTFKIAFTADNPQLAKQVASRLASLFIEENFKTRGTQAASTSNFLAEQLEAAKQKVAEQEQRLTDFKMRNLGQLPEQQGANLGNMADLRIQLQTIGASLTRTQQQREQMESSINGNLARLQSEKAVLLSRYTPRHPEVAKKDLEIAKTQALISSLKTGKFEAESSQGSASPDDATAAKLKRQVEDIVIETQNLSNEERRVNAEIAKYQVRLNLTPVREQELSAIMRDADVSKANYTDLLRQQQQSQLTTKVEERQEGQHFRLAEAPTMPKRPSSPNRAKISLSGIGIGLLLGLAVALFLEFRDRSFHTEKGLSSRFALPLVLGLPLLLTPAEKNAQRWKSAAEWFTGSAVLLSLCAVELYVLRHG
jgi:polysaccharide biosynthesis transport protein